MQTSRHVPPSGYGDRHDLAVPARPSVRESPRRLPPGARSRVADATGAPEQLRLRAKDGRWLGAIRYPAHDGVSAHVVVAGAIGVPQGFYRRFAAHAAARGCTVWTVDYRGIGLSGQRSLCGFRADLVDWGTFDLDAAVDGAFEEARCDGVPVYLVGHSFGGQALGLLPNPARIDACYTFGTGAGWHGWMSPVERTRVLALWHVIVP